MLYNLCPFVLILFLPLHLMLRCVEDLLRKTVMRDVGSILSEKGDKSQAEVLHDYLAYLGIYIKLSVLKTTGGPDYAGSMLKKSFTGKECWTLLTYFQQILEIVYPSVLQDDAVFVTAYKGYLSCWTTFLQVMLLLSKDFEKFDDKAQQVLEYKNHAANLRGAAFDFLTAKHQFLGKSGGVYHYILIAHAPDMVSILGSLKPYSGQGIEHMHVWAKDALKNCSNRQQLWRLGSVSNIITVRQQSYQKSHTQEKDSQTHMIYIACSTENRGFLPNFCP
jgi:hypothetical protein